MNTQGLSRKEEKKHLNLLRGVSSRSVSSVCFLFWRLAHFPRHTSTLLSFFFFLYSVYCFTLWTRLHASTFKFAWPPDSFNSFAVVFNILKLRFLFLFAIRILGLSQVCIAFIEITQWFLWFITSLLFANWIFFFSLRNRLRCKTKASQIVTRDHRNRFT